MLQLHWLSTHFVARTIFVSPSLPPKPASSTRPFGPVRPTKASTPTSGFHRHRRPSGRATMPCTANCRLLHARRAKLKRCHASFTSPTESVSSHLLFPLTHSKPTGVKTPPSPASSPPPHRLLGPIKCTPASASPHRTHCSPPSLFSTSPVARHRASPPPSPPLHRRPHPAIALVTKARGKDWQDPL
jgi:hypothetical protein